MNIYEALYTTRAMRRVRPDPIPHEVQARILDAAGLPTLPIGGAYFLLTDVGHLGAGGDVGFCRRLVTEVGVAAIPTSVFYADPASAPPLARFCFAKKDQTLEAAAERFARARSGRTEPGAPEQLT